MLLFCAHEGIVSPLQIYKLEEINKVLATKAHKWDTIDVHIWGMRSHAIKGGLYFMSIFFKYRLIFNRILNHLPYKTKGP
jgi:hypothetical protein